MIRALTRTSSSTLKVAVSLKPPCLASVDGNCAAARAGRVTTLASTTRTSRTRTPSALATAFRWTRLALASTRRNTCHATSANAGVSRS
ncbi:MAG: hypothetical protein Q6370_010575 [Candidatus Sigynarchaeota archaeon]